ncbi:MAG: hypothetical protein A3G41_04360 [Elusimicrobia bacterium RIFCSPLOWO2_12_FULL_59_9]|nr:MAG: hypothetical protein A3G41_04360 [Elusimicrobia bacterium RIFCSPLOWO2_12_FULL_59_9]
MSKVPLATEFQGFRVVTAAQMQEIDRRASAEHGISAEALMENAGRAIAQETLSYLESALRKAPAGCFVLVACGRGNNGGDGLAAARHLKEKGVPVQAWIAAPKRDLPRRGGQPAAPPAHPGPGSSATGATSGGYGELVRLNLERARQAGVEVLTADEDLERMAAECLRASVLIDALLGTGSQGKPLGTVQKMIQAMMKSKRPILAVDIPSGINADTGYHSGVFIQAAWTFTLGLPKAGLMATHAKRYVGELKVIDIGFPKQLLEAESLPAEGQAGEDATRGETK